MRQSLQHQAYTQVLGRRSSLTSVTLPPFPVDILDIGTGTGEWAIRMAEHHRHCTVVGTDISAIAPREDIPVNVSFEIEDAEDCEDRVANKYDLVHLRGMAGAFRDWISVYDSVLESLKPGAWIEVQDVTGITELFTDNFSVQSPTHELFADLKVAADKTGRKQGEAHLESRLFWETGFKEVTVTEHPVPLASPFGEMWLITILDGIEAMTLRMLTEHMGWEAEECKEACERAARDLAMLVKDPERSDALSVSIKTVIGRKPL